MSTNHLPDAQSTDASCPMERSPDALQFEQAARFYDIALHLLNGCYKVLYRYTK